MSLSSSKAKAAFSQSFRKRIAPPEIFFSLSDQHVFTAAWMLSLPVCGEAFHRLFLFTSWRL